ncbi:hypothetical protein D3C85_964520 [compost metagenome]
MQGHKACDFLLGCSDFLFDIQFAVLHHLCLCFSNQLMQDLWINTAWSCLRVAITLLSPAQYLNNKPAQPTTLSFLLHTHSHARRSLAAIRESNEPSPPSWQRLRPILRFLILFLIVLAILKDSRHGIGYVKRPAQHGAAKWKCPLEPSVAATFTTAYSVIIIQHQPYALTGNDSKRPSILVELCGNVCFPIIFSRAKNQRRFGHQLPFGAGSYVLLTRSLSLK